MFNSENVKKYASNWAYDLSKKVIVEGEIVNEDVINQSIEMILATPPGSRLFNLSFGSTFMYKIFDNMDADYLEAVIDDTVGAIKTWEDRIKIQEGAVKLKVYPDSNTMLLVIPYTIIDRRIKGEFSKVISQ